MDVIETWNVYISETNTLFKTFNDTVSDYFEITDVKISEVLSSGHEKFLDNVNQQQYHVDPGGYYGLRINPAEFEIAWNVGLDNSSATRTYKMYYTVENVVKQYKDCNEIYWQFLADSNGMSGKNITGRIKLPKPVSDIEKLRVWGHGNLIAEIHKTSPSLVEFSQSVIDAGEMFEIRVVTEEDMYNADIKNKISNPMLSNIIREETVWADEANAKREEAKRITKIMKVIICVAIAGNCVILYIFINKTKQYAEIREELIREYGNDEFTMEMEYFRDIPEEKNATPARAEYLRNFRKNSSNIRSSLSKIFSATILNLSLKKILYFEVIDEKNVRIFIENDADMKVADLPKDEAIVFRLIKRAMGFKNSITIKEFNKYASREYDEFYDQMNKLEKAVEDELLEQNRISREKKAKLKVWNNKQITFFILGFIFAFILYVIPAIPIGLFILAISARKTATCISLLTYEGQAEVYMWKGLKKFMEDYSMLDERLVPDIVIWEKYLVYATAFGIADKVIKQLKIVHPEMFDRSDMYYRHDRYGYWNMVGSSNDGVLFNNFNKGLSNVYSKAMSSYSAAHSSSSSGSGGGGGFSGGGGGGGGGGSCGGR